MARLIPKQDVSEIQNRGERDVARALVQQLPDECVVYHSYPWLRPERNSWSNRLTLKEGEADFVVLDPRRGILVLEVKGGEIEYDPIQRVWHRVLPRGLDRITDPFEQARRNQHAIQQEIARVGFPGRQQMPFAYGHAVVFPDCFYSGSVPCGADPVIVLSAQNMPTLGESVRKALSDWDPLKDRPALDPETVRGIQKGLTGTFRLVPALSRQIEAEEEQLVRLTDGQAKLLDTLQVLPRAYITGVAGSGKTLLAVMQAKRFASQGKRTLFVCYTKPLAEWIRETLPTDLASHLVVKNFHELCREFVHRTGGPFYPPSQDADVFWKEDAPLLLTQAAQALGERFDALVVDESQDFLPMWWLALSELEAQPGTGPCYVFGDPKQNLFGGSPLALANMQGPFVLSTNCRNTRNIAQFCCELGGVELDLPEQVPMGQACVCEVHTTPEAQKKRCEEVVSNWLNQGHLTPSQVAVLCPRSRPNSPLAGVTKMGGKPLTETMSMWRKGSGVLYSTIRAFKGLEADAVILLDLPKADTTDHFSQSDFYVAASRAKHLLVVLARE